MEDKDINHVLGCIDVFVRDMRLYDNPPADYFASEYDVDVELSAHMNIMSLEINVYKDFQFTDAVELYENIKTFAELKHLKLMMTDMRTRSMYCTFEVLNVMRRD